MQLQSVKKEMLLILEDTFIRNYYNNCFLFYSNDKKVNLHLLSVAFLNCGYLISGSENYNILIWNQHFSFIFVYGGLKLVPVKKKKRLADVNLILRHLK